MNMIPPAAFEVPSIASVQQEIFGPVLHIVRWSGDPLAVIGQINALGYGLTLGIQTRIDSRAQAMAHAARVGNVYINRNMIGAVVGVQPFGGEGLSGTWPEGGRAELPDALLLRADRDGQHDRGGGQCAAVGLSEIAALASQW
jgi:RHH-type proline utilization regulon transcriptional repressor/proline dehydrogenase/delta 1-pyrroline-5-carboxylate dehydrogenase